MTSHAQEGDDLCELPLRQHPREEVVELGTCGLDDLVWSTAPKARDDGLRRRCGDARRGCRAAAQQLAEGAESGIEPCGVEHRGIEHRGIEPSGIEPSGIEHRGVGGAPVSQQPGVPQLWLGPGHLGPGMRQLHPRHPWRSMSQLRRGLRLPWLDLSQRSRSSRFGAGRVPRRAQRSSDASTARDVRIHRCTGEGEEDGEDHYRPCSRAARVDVGSNVRPRHKGRDRAGNGDEGDPLRRWTSLGGVTPALQEGPCGDRRPPRDGHAREDGDKGDDPQGQLRAHDDDDAEPDRSDDRQRAQRHGSCRHRGEAVALAGLVRHPAHTSQCVTAAAARP